MDNHFLIKQFKLIGRLGKNRFKVEMERGFDCLIKWGFKEGSFEELNMKTN
jgi:hypothetical protein